MRGIFGTGGAVVCAILFAGVAQAEIVPGSIPTRPQYVAEIEPICKKNTEDNTRILKGARAKVNRDKMPAAGRQFIRASRAFGRAVRQIVAVPRPPADDARLRKWFKFLRIVQTNLKKIGLALKAENRVKANHEAIRAERSGNAANNVGSVFKFLHCHLLPSRFR
jgi:hypothetical protein